MSENTCLFFHHAASPSAGCCLTLHLKAVLTQGLKVFSFFQICVNMTVACLKSLLAADAEIKPLICLVQ